MLNSTSPTDPYFKGELPRALLKSVLIQNQQRIPWFIGGRIKIHVSFEAMPCPWQLKRRCSSCAQLVFVWWFSWWNSNPNCCVCVCSWETCSMRKGSMAKPSGLASRWKRSNTSRASAWASWSSWGTSVSRTPQVRDTSILHLTPG